MKTLLAVLIAVACSLLIGIQVGLNLQQEQNIQKITREHVPQDENTIYYNPQLPDTSLPGIQSLKELKPVSGKVPNYSLTSKENGYE